MSVEHEFNVSAGCRTTQSVTPDDDAIHRRSSTNDCGSFCHASTIVRCSSSTETKFWRW